MIRAFFAAFLALWFLWPSWAGAAPSGAVIVNVRNSTDGDRPSETIVLKAGDLTRLLAVDDVRRVHVHDQQSKQELLVQAIDDNDDGSFEEFLFQTDIRAHETKSFRLTVGDRQVPRPSDFRAYGRFVRERHDDFAWENDRIAHRMYGVGLETSAQEPLTSSAIDVWTKRLPRLVINDWYMVDDYHNDHGEGGDFYSAGSSRGCGGNGIWVGGRLYPSANFRSSRVLANGPIRVIFELVYEVWDAHGTRLSEVKRITLDAGQNFDRFESHYTIESGARGLTDAIGIRKAAGSIISTPRGAAWMRTWEPLPQNEGQLGIAVIVDPATFLGSAEDPKNYLLLVKIPAESVVTYYAGFGWNKSGQFQTLEEWDHYVTDFASRVRTPVDVTLAPE